MNTDELPIVADLETYPGATLRKQFLWRDAEDNPVDLTGYTGRLLVGLLGAQDTSPEQVLPVTGSSGGVELGGTDGTITATLTSAYTRSLASTSDSDADGVAHVRGVEWPYIYQIDLIEPGGDSYPFAWGMLSLADTLVV